MRYDGYIRIIHTFSRLIRVPVDSITIMEAIQKHPLVDSARMISDVLDTIGIQHEAFMLRKEMLELLDSPAILCTMSAKFDLLVIIPSSSDCFKAISTTGKNIQLHKKDLCQIGEAVLITPSDTQMRGCKRIELKGIARELIWMLFSHKRLLILFTLFAISLIKVFTYNSVTDRIWILLMTTGILVSSIMEAKRYSMKDSILSAFCDRKGEDICTTVINTPFLGIKTVSLADVSLSFFLMMFFSSSSSLLQVETFSSFLFSCISIGFVVYSLVWQIERRTICPFCITIDGILLISFSLICYSAVWVIDIASFLHFAIAGLVFLAIFMLIITVSSGLKAETELANNLDKHKALLADGNLFWDIVGDEELLFDDNELPLCSINNNVENDKCLVLIINPKCEQCKRLFDDIYNNKNIRIIILFYAFPRDITTQASIEEILESEDNKWEKCIELMFGTYKRLDKNVDAKNSCPLLKQHLDFIDNHSIMSTPSVFINGKSFPACYSMRDLAIIL